MNEQVSPFFPIKGIPGPLLRPLPFLFGFGRLALESPEEVQPEGRRLFTAHLRAFKAMLIAATRTTGLVPEAIRPVLLRCNALAGSSGGDLWEHLLAFQRELLALHGEHGPLIKEGAAAAMERLEGLFRTETGPRRLATVYSDQTWPKAEKLDAKLTGGCWYDCVGCREKEGTILVNGVDLAVFVPGVGPIRPDLEQVLAQAGVPILVLAGLGRPPGRPGLAALRTLYLYRQRGYPVFQGPPTTLRLFQAIDGHLVRHLTISRPKPAVAAMAAC